MAESVIYVRDRTGNLKPRLQQWATDHGMSDEAAARFLLDRALTAEGRSADRPSTTSTESPS